MPKLSFKEIKNPDCDDYESSYFRDSKGNRVYLCTKRFCCCHHNYNLCTIKM